MLGRKASKSTVTARRGVREDRAKSVCVRAQIKGEPTMLRT